MGIVKNILTTVGLLPKKPKSFPTDFEALHKEIIDKAEPFTMTSPERMFSLMEAVKHITRYRIPGAIVECGVWKGGSMLTVAETLVKLNDLSRDLFLYDTFEGMSAPTEVDENFAGRKADQLLRSNTQKEQNLVWAYSTLDTVKATMALSSYPSDKINYQKGKVEDTIPHTMPAQIALLRLDTDWYESTKHELEHLFPLLQPGGILIIDDYGFWKGARKAVDEYFAQNNISIFLSRIDDTGRIAVKPH